MANNVQEFDVTLSIDILKNQLTNLFKDPIQGALMSECMIDLIGNDSSKLGILCRTALNIAPDIRYKVGDEVLCKASSMSTWNWNRQEMQNQGLIKDNHLKAIIREINKYAVYPYEVEFSYIPDKSTIISTTTENVTNNTIKQKIENFI